MPPHDEAPDPEELSLSATFRAWGATEDDLPALVARARARGTSRPRDVWIHHLYETHVDALVRFAAAKIGSIEDAQEVVQEVFIRVVADLSRYDRTRGAPRAWLFNLAYGLASNRARAIRRGGVARDDLDTLAGTWGDLPDVAPDLRRALAALPPECVEVLWLRRVEELTQAETAHVLSLQFGTVQSRLARAERLLREALPRDEKPERGALAAVLLLGDGDLSPDLEGPIRSLRRTYPLPPERRRALWDRVKAVLPPVSVRPPAPSRTLPRMAATHALAASLGVAVAALWVRSRRPAPAPEVAPKAEVVRADLALKRSSPMFQPAFPGVTLVAPSPSLPAVAPAERAVDAGGVPLTMGTVSRAATTQRSRGSDTSGADREVALQALRRARAALARRAVDDARLALDEAERAMGPGDSREHLDSLRVEEALLAGDRARAAALVARFRQRYPASAHLARLEAWTR